MNFLFVAQTLCNQAGSHEWTTGVVANVRLVKKLSYKKKSESGKCCKITWVVDPATPEER